jgi:hypothetical protein
MHSATQIAALGQQQFLNKAVTAGITAKEAAQIYQTAAHRYAQVVSLYMQFNRDAAGVLPTAMASATPSPSSINSVVQVDPSLATLFGSQDYCAIDDCTSVLSPAAYLCDLLLWLKNHPQSVGTALDVLDRRRPDIRHLLLNCANSDTELPYIDLVIELLADRISPPISTTLTEAILASTTPSPITVADGSGNRPKRSQQRRLERAARSAGDCSGGCGRRSGGDTHNRGQSTVEADPG